MNLPCYQQDDARILTNVIEWTSTCSDLLVIYRSVLLFSRYGSLFGPGKRNRTSCDSQWLDLPLSSNRGALLPCDLTVSITARITFPSADPTGR